MKGRTAGFTLVEILVVIVIMAMSASLVLAWVKGIRRSEFKQRVRALAEGLRLSVYRSLVSGEPVSITVHPDCSKVEFSWKDVKWNVKLPKGTRCYAERDDELAEVEERMVFTISGMPSFPKLIVKLESWNYTIDPKKLTLWEEYETSS